MFDDAMNVYAIPNRGMYDVSLRGAGVDDAGRDVSIVRPHQDLLVAPARLTATTPDGTAATYAVGAGASAFDAAGPGIGRRGGD